MLILVNCGYNQTVRARLAALLKHKTTYFEQHNTHFHTLFYPHVYKKHSNNIIQTNSPNRPLELEKGTVKVVQTRSNLIDGLKSTRLCEIWFSGKVFSGLLGIGVVVINC